MLNDPAFKNICFWSKLSWEFVIADPGTFTKYFAKEFKLDSKNVNFSHVSKAYKIVELSTIYGQLIITRIKSKRNTWKLFPDHYGVGYPSLKNAGDSSLAGTILIGEEQKFLTRLKKKITKEIKTDKKKKNPCDNNIYKYPHIDVKRLKMDGQK
uniref:Uncharacterized protein n=1 Tax=Parastrongyloides trichosuri TaxID=131310 RepID=A0A0N4ZHV0_PARTI